MIDELRVQFKVDWNLTPQWTLAPTQSRSGESKSRSLRSLHFGYVLWSHTKTDAVGDILALYTTPLILVGWED